MKFGLDLWWFRALRGKGFPRSGTSVPQVNERPKADASEKLTSSPGSWKPASRTPGRGSARPGADAPETTTTTLRPVDVIVCSAEINAGLRERFCQDCSRSLAAYFLESDNE